MKKVVHWELLFPPLYELVDDCFIQVLCTVFYNMVIFRKQSVIEAFLFGRWTSTIFHEPSFHLIVGSLGRAPNDREAYLTS